MAVQFCFVSFYPGFQQVKFKQILIYNDGLVQSRALQDMGYKKVSKYDNVVKIFSEYFHWLLIDTLCNVYSLPQLEVN